MECLCAPTWLALINYELRMNNEQTNKTSKGEIFASTATLCCKEQARKRTVLCLCPCTAALPALLCRARSYPSSSHRVWPVAGEPPIPVFRPLIFISGECTHSSVNALVVANFTRLWADLGIGLNIHLSRPCFFGFFFEA